MNWILELCSDCSCSYVGSAVLGGDFLFDDNPTEGRFFILSSEFLLSRALLTLGLLEWYAFETLISDW
jgi:hypothetical protein